MQANADLTDLLVALNEEDAKYLIVGGYAFAFHGRPRATKDVDIFVGTDTDNAKRVWRALLAFGAPLSDLSESDLSTPDVIFSMGLPPNQIDIITSIDGITFAEAWEARVADKYGGIPLWYIAKADLIANKKAVARAQDLADVEYLEGGLG
ncbi:MAG TPA: DUF6036 family nucleotidyltransferase [Candidatus Cybelea sp.]|jgi:hypothetical protein